MANFAHAKECITGGVLFKSETEANWAALFNEIELLYRYEPYRFLFPITPRYEYWDYNVLVDIPCTYTPDFRIVPNNRFVEIKNGNVDADACRKINDLARLLCMHTVLVDGNLRSSTVYTFDGREPTSGWETSDDPAKHFAYSRTRECTADDTVNAMLQTSAYETVTIPPFEPRLSKIAEIARSKVIIATSDIGTHLAASEAMLANPPREIVLTELAPNEEALYDLHPRLI